VKHVIDEGRTVSSGHELATFTAMVMADQQLWSRPPEQPAATTSPGAFARDVAAELHDGVAQQLFAASLDVEEMLDLRELPDEARQRLERLADRLSRSSRDLRSVLHAMLAGRPRPTSDSCVLDRVHARLADVHSDITVDLQVTGEGPEPDAVAGDLVVRAVTEGLANIVKHGDASQALVLIRRGTSWWTVEVHDDGIGDPAEVRIKMAQRSGMCFGLCSLADEARRLGGRIWISGAARLGGISLSLSVPVPVPVPVHGD
jgi:signal transduction histidine kinase